MSDDFIRTIVDDDDITNNSELVDEDDEEELGTKSLNPKFWFDVTEADLTTQQPWDFTSAKKASMADDGQSSIDDKIRYRVALRKEREARANKRKKLVHKEDKVVVENEEIDNNEAMETEDNDDINDENNDNNNNSFEDYEEDENNQNDEEDVDDVNIDVNETELVKEDENEKKEKKKNGKKEIDVIKEITTKTKKMSKEQKEFFGEAPEIEAVMTFEDIGIAKPLLKAVNMLGYVKPTPIQAKTIPIALLGKDIVGSAQTGSGKTAAFMLPIIHKLLISDRRTPMIRCLVLTPTRELAVQCHSVVEKLSQFTTIRACLVVGGLSNTMQETALRTNPDIVVATPGRIIDHLRNAKNVALDDLEYFVIDEADRMLEVGFMDAVEQIIKFCPRNRQSLLFSATMTDTVAKLIKISLNKPIRISVDKTTDVATNLTQEFIKVKREETRDAVLLALCSRTVKSKALIFFPEKRFAHRMKIIFGLAGLNASELHGNMTQKARLEALEKFRDGETNYLLCTDVASRGLDILGVESIINYTMPKTMTTYIHRVGRTARAGEKGLSISLAGDHDRNLLKQIIKHANNKVKQRIVPVESITEWVDTIKGMDRDIKAIIKEEFADREIRKAETEATRIENIVLHEDEIMSRPKKTWFQSEREKREVRQKSKEEAEERTVSLEDEDDEDEDNNNNRMNKKRKRTEGEREKERARKEQIRGRIKEKEKKERERDFRQQTASGKSIKNQDRLRRIGMLPPESKKKKEKRPRSAGPNKGKSPSSNKRSKSNFDNDKPRMKDFDGSSGGKGKKAFKSQKRYKRR